MSSCGIVIPANLNSTRFPGKPLALVGGKPLLSYAVECAKGTGLPYVVATSDQEIVEWCIQDGMPILMATHGSVSSNSSVAHSKCKCIDTPKFRNGTERAAFCNKHVLGWDRVIVLQCDEPDVTSDDLRDFEAVSYGTYTITSDVSNNDWGNPNSVIVRGCSLIEGAGRLFDRGVPEPNWKVSHPLGHPFRRHVGVYHYEADILEEYLNHPPTPCELSMSLEQLRTMAMGYAWYALKIERPLRSVNVPEDVNQFQEDGKV